MPMKVSIIETATTVNILDPNSGSTETITITDSSIPSGGGNMKIGEPVVDALPRRALFTDDDGNLTDDVMKSKDISFFGGLLTGKAVKPVNFVHDDSMVLGGIDATSFGGTESFGVLQSTDRSGSFAYTKVDFNNLDTVPPETLFLIGYDASTGKSSIIYHPNGILSDPSPMFTIDETGVVIAGTQKFNAVVTNFDSPLDTNIPTALATRTQMMSLLGTYSYGSDSINFYGGASNVPLGDYTPYNGDLLRIRTGGSKDFGFGLVYGQVGDFIYYDDDEWKPLFNPKRVANATSNSLLATGSVTNNEIQTLDTATYPSLTEISYAKGVTSAIQTQINDKKTDSMATNKLLGRGTAGTGAIEDITLGTNLSLSGTTLNATGGSVATDTIWDAKGDMAIGTGANTAVRLPIGFDGQVPIATSNETTGIRYARPASNHYFASGYYTPSHSFNTTSGGNQTNNRMFFVPITVGKRQTFDRAAIYHASGASNAGSVTRIGIYSQNQTEDIPDALLHDFGSIPIDVGAGSAKELSFSVTLEPGAYWMGIVCQFTGTAPSLSGGAASVGMPQLSLPVSSAFLVQNSISGALPNPAVPNALVGTAPVVWFRKA